MTEEDVQKKFKQIDFAVNVLAVAVMFMSVAIILVASSKPKIISK